MLNSPSGAKLTRKIKEFNHGPNEPTRTFIRQSIPFAGVRAVYIGIAGDGFPFRLGNGSVHRSQKTSQWAKLRAAKSDNRTRE
jgi:hypothetical protein